MGGLYTRKTGILKRKGKPIRQVRQGRGKKQIRERFSKNYHFDDIKDYWYKDVEDFKKLSRKYYLYK